MGVQIREEDLGWERIKKDFEKLAGSRTEAGLYGSGSNPATNLAYRGAIQEFGSPKQGIPSRPFEREAWDRNLERIWNRNINEIGDVIDGDQSPRRALARLGEYVQGLIQRSIVSGLFKSLAMSTITAKGSTRPLIDSGEMRRSVTHKEFIK